jgi:hypothetical protein
MARWIKAYVSLSAQQMGFCGRVNYKSDSKIVGL